MKKRKRKARRAPMYCTGRTHESVMMYLPSANGILVSYPICTGCGREIDEGKLSTGGLILLGVTVLAAIGFPLWVLLDGFSRG